MITNVILHEEPVEAGKFRYHVIEGHRLLSDGAQVPIEIRDANIYIFEFEIENSTLPQKFTVACYTLDEALYTFLNMYKNVQEFTVTIKS
jgi:hypothetical protein